MTKSGCLRRYVHYGICALLSSSLAVSSASSSAEKKEMKAPPPQSTLAEWAVGSVELDRAALDNLLPRFVIWPSYYAPSYPSLQFIGPGWVQLVRHGPYVKQAEYSLRGNRICIKTDGLFGHCFSILEMRNSTFLLRFELESGSHYLVARIQKDK